MSLEIAKFDETGAGHGIDWQLYRDGQGWVNFYQGEIYGKYPFFNQYRECNEY